MKIYWADREGKPPPPDAKFHWRPFSSLFELPAEVEQIAHLPSPPGALKPIAQSFAPTQEEWVLGVEKALAAIRKRELQKVVLARCLTLEFLAPIDPFAIVSALKQRALNAYLFCIQTESFSFLGASPERLFMRKGRYIESEAVAGTRKRGSDFAEDEKLKWELLSSEKELREFFFVQNYLTDSLHPFCLDETSLSPLKVRSTQNVQHLYRKFKAYLKEKVSDEDLLEALHPTPALCGMPKQQAYEMIQEIEPFKRGLYGGAIGWKTEETSEWLVGIRSCLIEGNRVKLYTGTGIVEGSDPLEEWEEMNQKLKLYEGILF